METGVAIALGVVFTMAILAVLIAVIAAVSTVSGFHSPQEDENN